MITTRCPRPCGICGTTTKQVTKGFTCTAGTKNNTVIRRGFLSSFYNLDVNCNSREGDYVTGLNQKSIPSSPDFACVVGNGYGSSGDFVVNLWSQNLNNFYALSAPVFYHPYGHTEAIQKATFQTMYALDEPSDFLKAYQVKLNVPNRGYLTVQGDNSTYDVDRFRFEVPGRGVVSFALNANSEAKPTCRIVSYNGSVHGTFSGVGTGQAPVPVGGTYFLEVSGQSGKGWRSYNFALSHCPLPDVPTLTATTPTTFCEGGTTMITATDGYDEYRWFRNGLRLPDAGRTLTARQSGTYTVEASKCGITSASTNSVAVQVKPVPAVPTVSLDPITGQLTSSSPTGNQWLLNGAVLTGATAQQLPKGALGAGSYTVQVTLDGCQSTSAPFVITGIEPTASAVVTRPNPATEYVTISGFSGQSAVTLTLCNRLGEVLSIVNIPAGTANYELPLGELAPGVYLIKLEGDGQTYRSKLVVF